MIYIVSLQVTVVAAIVSLFILIRCLSGPDASKSQLIASLTVRMVLSIALLGLCTWRMLEFIQYAMELTVKEKGIALICFLAFFILCNILEYFIEIGKAKSSARSYCLIKNKWGYLTAVWTVNTGVLLQFVSIGMMYVMVRETPYSTKHAGITSQSMAVLIVGIVITIGGSLAAAFIGSNRIQVKSDGLLVTVHNLMQYKHYSIDDINTLRMDTTKRGKVLVIQWKDAREDKIDFWDTQEDAVFLSMMKATTTNEKLQADMQENISRFQSINHQSYHGSLMRDRPWQIITSRFFWIAIVEVAIIFII